MTCTIRKKTRANSMRSDPDAFEYIATCDDRPAGELFIKRTEVRRICGDQECKKEFRDLDTSLVRTVEHIEVEKRARRRGIATMLYEAAAKDACRAAEPLVSYYRSRGAKSSKFWVKQKGKARASVVGKFRMGDLAPAIYIHDCAAGTSFAGLCTKTKKRSTKKRRR